MTPDTRPACNRPPSGYECTRAAGHDGPCAAVAVTERRPHEHLTYIYTGPQVENEAAAKAYVKDLMHTGRMAMLADYHPTPLVRALAAALASEPAATTDMPPDARFLHWLADRLVHIYRADPRVDFVLATRRIADRVAAEPTDNKAPSEGLLQIAEFEAHNRALRAAVEAIRDTESRAVAVERIEALQK